jgi:hypothetical protein
MIQSGDWRFSADDGEAFEGVFVDGEAEGFTGRNLNT